MPILKKNKRNGMDQFRDVHTVELTLGLEVKMTNPEYKSEYADVDLTVVGIQFKDYKIDNLDLDITLDDGDGCSDGWNWDDISPKHYPRPPA